MNQCVLDNLIVLSLPVCHVTLCFADHMTMSPSQEKMTLKRVMDFVIDRGDENLREINKKLQRIVEETLTKNMHLQGVSVGHHLVENPELHP